jgi:hypothetical protein
MRSAGADSFNEIATLRIELPGSDPLIWREVELPTSVTLKVLHEIVQATMGWLDSHLWELTVGERRYGPPMDEDEGAEPCIDAAKVRLRDVLGPSETTMDYLYDFGDSWEHRLIVTDVRPGDPDASYPRYVAGERGGPPEDCGGLPGFYEMLAVARDPGHPDHAEAKEWLGDRDPDTVDELPISYALLRIARRRNAMKAQLAKRRESTPGR